MSFPKATVALLDRAYEVDIETRTVDAHVYRLRKKIEVDSERPRYIHSVPGIGYRFAVD